MHAHGAPLCVKWELILDFTDNDADNAMGALTGRFSYIIEELISIINTGCTKSVNFHWRRCMVKKFLKKVKKAFLTERQIFIEKHQQALIRVY